MLISKQNSKFIFEVMFHFYAVFHGNSLKIVKTVFYYVNFLVERTIVLKAINAIVNY